VALPKSNEPGQVGPKSKVDASRASEWPHVHSAVHPNGARIRRVKCGEEKPGCLRCQKFGRECDGYASEHEVRRNSTPVPIQPRPLLPPTPSSTLKIDYAPSSYVLPGEDQDHRSYQLFCERSTYDFGGYNPLQFWKRTILQEVNAEPSIRHAIVALDAVTGTLHDGSLDSFGVIVPVIVGIERHEFALKQYSEAILHLRQVLSQREARVRTALIASLLFVCFENFHGNYEAANRHMQCGLVLIEQFQLNQPLPSEIALVGQDLDLKVNDDVFQMFARLDAQAFAHRSSELSVYDPSRVLDYTTIEDPSFQIPAVFSSTSEARQAWDYIREKCVAFHRKAGIFRYPAAPCFSTFPPSPPQSSSSSFIAPGINLPDALQQEYHYCNRITAQWETAFWPLLVASQSPIPSLDGLPVWGTAETILYLCNKISKIYLGISETIGEEAFDLYQSDFEEIVLRSAPLIEAARITGEMPAGPVPSSALSFELGVIPPLHLTALKCRNAKIRREAIALLLSCPQHEGSWDGFMLGKVDAWVMGLEEASADEWGFIPEDKRWRLADIKLNSYERWIWARCYRSEWDGFGGVISYTADCREIKMTR
jgi:hypothetical protein